MEKIEIRGLQSNSLLLIGESFKNFRKYIPDTQIIILTDNKVNGIYGKYFADYPVIEIGQTEQIKTLSTVEYIIDKLLDFNVGRNSFLLAVGGGIVCDITGFVASIYLRGIKFGFISTTLLSQVDASVGGKNGVNFKGYKNMIGIFNQPEFVICDLQMLTTLDNKDLISGFGEIVKHTLIANAKMFAELEKHTDNVLNLDLSFIEKLVADSVKIKSHIVNIDEKEKGERRKLNLGHTYGHAVEKVLKISHGKAVSIGIAASAKLSLNKKYITQQEYNRIINLLIALQLPVEATEKQNEILEAMIFDKKKEGDSINFVLLKGIGNVVVEKINTDKLKTELTNKNFNS
jgi:3-dehydroquinate synthase